MRKIRSFLNGKWGRLIIKGGYRFAIFAVCLEVFEHTILPAIMIYVGRPELCWVGATPLDELVIYPIAIKILTRR